MSDFREGMDLTFWTDFVDFLDFTESDDFFDFTDICEDFFLTSFGLEISVVVGSETSGSCNDRSSSHRPVHELLGTVVGSE